MNATRENRIATEAAAETAGWKAAGYARLSREDRDACESNSIEAQRKIIQEWAAAEPGATLSQIYVDDGWSGANFDRPGFKQMIRDAQAGAFDTIVVKDLSRFGRSYLDCGFWIERELPRLGIRLFSITDNFDSSCRWSSDTALLVPIKNLMNEMAVATTSEKVRMSLAAKRNRGEFVGNFAPYGYRRDERDPHRLAIDRQAADVVARIFQMRLQGKSATEIARELNADGTPSPARYRQMRSATYANALCRNEKPRWHAESVLKVLRNEMYTGTLVQGKTQRTSWRAHASELLPEDQWTRTENAHEAIVCKEDFQAVAQVLQRDKRVARPAPNLQAKMYCADCGSKLRRVSVKSNGRRYTYYSCAGHRKNPRSCSTHSIREEALLHELQHLPDDRPDILPLEAYRIIVDFGSR